MYHTFHPVNQKYSAKMLVIHSNGWGEVVKIISFISNYLFCSCLILNWFNFNLKSLIFPRTAYSYIFILLQKVLSENLFYKKIKMEKFQLKFGNCLFRKQQNKHWKAQKARNKNVCLKLPFLFFIHFAGILVNYLFSFLHVFLGKWKMKFSIERKKKMLLELLSLVLDLPL